MAAKIKQYLYQIHQIHPRNLLFHYWHNFSWYMLHQFDILLYSNCRILQWYPNSVSIRIVILVYEKKLYILYANHFNLQFVYFKPTFWRSKTFFPVYFSWSFLQIILPLCMVCNHEQFAIKSRLRWLAHRIWNA